jgi:signal transduction histidine kinase
VAAQPAFQKVEIDKTLDPSLPATEGDPVQLKEVFLNILSNAGEAMPGGGRVTVVSRFREVGSHPIEIMIRDTGQGIPQENLNKLFMPFFTTKKIGQGTGLGLAIAYGIVKMHRGAIEVQSKVGEGTTFWVKLPAESSLKSQESVG